MIRYFETYSEGKPFMKKVKIIEFGTKIYYGRQLFYVRYERKPLI